MLSLIRREGGRERGREGEKQRGGERESGRDGEREMEYVREPMDS